eukprot:jgi/Ulvmu1/1760/UM117_0037.1
MDFEVAPGLTADQAHADHLRRLRRMKYERQRRKRQQDPAAAERMRANNRESKRRRRLALSTLKQSAAEPSPAPVDTSRAEAPGAGSTSRAKRAAAAVGAASNNAAGNAGGTAPVRPHGTGAPEACSAAPAAASSSSPQHAAQPQSRPNPPTDTPPAPAANITPAADAAPAATVPACTTPQSGTAAAVAQTAPASAEQARRCAPAPHRSDPPAGPPAAVHAVHAAPAGAAAVPAQAPQQDPKPLPGAAELSGAGKAQFLQLLMHDLILAVKRQRDDEPTCMPPSAKQQRAAVEQDATTSPTAAPQPAAHHLPATQQGASCGLPATSPPPATATAAWQQRKSTPARRPTRPSDPRTSSPAASPAATAAELHSNSPRPLGASKSPAAAPTTPPPLQNQSPNSGAASMHDVAQAAPCGAAACTASPPRFVCLTDLQNRSSSAGAPRTPPPSTPSPKRMHGTSSPVHTPLPAGQPPSHAAASSPSTPTCATPSLPQPGMHQYAIDLVAALAEASAKVQLAAPTARQAGSPPAEHSLPATPRAPSVPAVPSAQARTAAAGNGGSPATPAPAATKVLRSGKVVVKTPRPTTPSMPSTPPRRAHQPPAAADNASPTPPVHTNGAAALPMGGNNSGVSTLASRGREAQLAAATAAAHSTQQRSPLSARLPDQIPSTSGGAPGSSGAGQIRQHALQGHTVTLPGKTTSGASSELVAALEGLACMSQPAAVPGAPAAAPPGRSTPGVEQPSTQCASPSPGAAPSLSPAAALVEKLAAALPAALSTAPPSTLAAPHRQPLHAAPAAAPQAVAAAVRPCAAAQSTAPAAAQAPTTPQPRTVAPPAAVPASMASVLHAAAPAARPPTSHSIAPAAVPPGVPSVVSAAAQAPRATAVGPAVSAPMRHSLWPPPSTESQRLPTALSEFRSACSRQHAAAPPHPPPPHTPAQPRAVAANPPQTQHATTAAHPLALRLLQLPPQPVQAPPSMQRTLQPPTVAGPALRNPVTPQPTQTTRGMPARSVPARSMPPPAPPALATQPPAQLGAAMTAAAAAPLSAPARTACAPAAAGSAAAVAQRCVVSSATSVPHSAAQHRPQPAPQPAPRPLNPLMRLSQSMASPLSHPAIPTPALLRAVPPSTASPAPQPQPTTGAARAGALRAQHSHVFEQALAAAHPVPAAAHPPRSAARAQAPVVHANVPMPTMHAPAQHSPVPPSLPPAAAPPPKQQYAMEEIKELLALLLELRKTGDTAAQHAVAAAQGVADAAAQPSACLPSGPPAGVPSHPSQRSIPTIIKPDPDAPPTLAEPASPSSRSPQPAIPRLPSAIAAHLRTAMHWLYASAVPSEQPPLTQPGPPTPGVITASLSIVATVCRLLACVDMHPGEGGQALIAVARRIASGGLPQAVAGASMHAQPRNVCARKAARRAEALAALLAALDAVSSVPDAFAVLHMWLQQIFEGLLQGSTAATEGVWAPRTPSAGFLYEGRCVRVYAVLAREVLAALADTLDAE